MRLSINLFHSQNGLKASLLNKAKKNLKILSELHCIFFFFRLKKRPKTNLEKCHQCSVSIEISLDLKVCFSLVTYKINNLIALCLTTQIT